MFNGALPTFAIGWVGIALAAVRTVWLVGLLQTGGALLFAAREAGDQDARFRHRLMRLVLAGLAVAAIGWVALVVGQTASFASTASPREVLSALPDVLRETGFGRVAVAQIVLLAAAAATLPFAGRGPARWIAAALALAAVGLQVGDMHAWAIEAGPGLLTGAALLHLLGAAIWLGGLLPLRILVNSVSPAAAAAASRRFSVVAAVGVLMLAAGALGQGWNLLGGLPGLVGTSYGWTALLKAVLFVVLLWLAVRNRFKLTPALARPDPTPARDALLRSIAVETWIGIAVVLAASLLGAQQPGLHAEPVWPFTMQPSLERARDNLPLAGWAAAGVLAVLVALGLLVAVRGWRRWPALVLLAVAVWFAVPRLKPLLVPALPTSFYVSPTGFAATSIVAGAALYPPNCARCHGPEGHGDGSDAAGLTPPPGNLTAAALRDRPDGEVFWWLSHGIAAPHGGLAMPGFATTLDADARWHLIDYLRAHTAGLARHAAAGTAQPERPPEIDIDCGPRTLALADLRGRLVRLVFQADATPPPVVPDPPGVGVATVLVPHDDAPTPPNACVASDPAVPAAYAIALDEPAGSLDGREVLIDQNGALREITPPHVDAVALANTLRRIAANPLAASATPAHLQHHS